MQRIKTLVLYAGVLAVSIALGHWGTPFAVNAYHWAFPEPPYETGDYSDLYREAGSAVVVFSTSTCPHCAHARDFLNREHLQFHDYVVDVAEDAATKFQSVGGQNVPLIFIGDRRITGFDEAKIRDALTAANIAVR